MDKHASSLNNVSILFGEAGEWQERLRTLTESTALREKLVAATPADDPRRERFLSNLGSCYGNLGSTHLDDGALDESIVWTRKALAIQDEQIKTHPNSVDYLERVGANHTVLGQLELRIGHLTAARAELEKGRVYLERLKHVRPGDATFQMHLVACIGLLSDVEIELSAARQALNLARRAATEAEEILRINPKYHPASQGLAGQLVREAEISWNLGEFGDAPAKMDRAEALLRQLVASYPESSRYRADLASTIAVRIRMDSELSRNQGVEARLREAVSLAESALREDPDQISNLASTAAIDCDLAACLVRPEQLAEAKSLFGRAFELLEKARKRSPGDQQIRRTMVQTTASHAAFLGRLGRTTESLAALNLIGKSEGRLTDHDNRRLYRTLSDRGFDPLRERPAFQLLKMDVAFPAQPFARPERE